MDNNFQKIINSQRQLFYTSQTKTYKYRETQLKRLQKILADNEKNITAALAGDLGKSYEEAMITEYLPVMQSLKHAIENLQDWMSPEKASTPSTLLPGRSRIHKEPYGVVLIIAPWNYPFLLCMEPLIGALAAGNCVIIKPSEMAKQTETIITELINQNFDQHHLTVINADADATQQLLMHQFDYIFYTGSTRVGREVMKAAAEHLTPVTLELGGKSPCIVDESANIAFAARRILWGKALNAGQTCIAPDFLLIHESVKDKFVTNFKKTYDYYYRDQHSSRIINRHHFDRLMNLIGDHKILLGGEHDEAKQHLSVTLLDVPNWQTPIMSEEIFGPLLPMLTFKNFDDVVNLLKPKPKPLALYLFSQKKSAWQKIINELSFGGGCLNDCLLQVANPNLPFGGVGESGMGSYHGKKSFDIFSHEKSVYQKLLSFDLKLEYPRNLKRYFGIIKRMLS